MTNLTKAFMAIGALLIIIAVVLRVADISLVIAHKALKPASFLILANISFVLAVLFKK